LIGTKVYEPYIRALLGTVSHFCKVVVLIDCRGQAVEEAAKAAEAKAKADAEAVHPQP